jgi:hypothetical protein
MKNLKPRKEAIAAGDKFYRGSPCQHGHGGKRWTANSHCVECQRAWQREYRRRQKDEIKQLREQVSEYSRDRV